MTWDPRTVLITGASRGIGAATAEELAARGYPLALTYRTGERAAHAVAERCLPLGAPQATVHRLDLLSNQDVREFAWRASPIATLINNAGVIDWTPFHAADFENIEWVLRSNVEGPLKFTSAMLGRVRDCILFIGSEIVRNPHPGLVVYSASKAALVSAALALAKASAEPTVLIVHPDRTATRMNEFGGRHPAEVARIVAGAVENCRRLASGSEIQI